MADVLENQLRDPIVFPVAGDVFEGRFTIEAVLNQGGFGCVFKAIQNDLGRPVAIKVLRPASRVGFNDDRNAEERRLEIVSKRFEREAQLVSQLRDPHTVLMYEYGQTPDGLLYMVLEFINGKALSEVVVEEGAISPQRAVAIVLQALSSLEEAHARGVLHRDIKPPNIMVYSHMGRRDQIKVLDFGLAKSMDDPAFTADNPDLTDDEVLIGTPRYMSPEQIRGHRLGPSTDIYSLGLVFYELLVGEKAVSAKSTMNTLARHINEVPIRLPDDLEIDAALRRIVNQMTEKDVTKRYASASAIMQDLENWKSDPLADFLDFEALDYELEELSEAGISGRRKLFGAAILFLFLVIAASYMFFSDTQAPAPKTPADVADVASTVSKPLAAIPVLEPKIEEASVQVEPIVVEPEPAPEPVKVAAPDAKVRTPRPTPKPIRKLNLTTLP